MVETYMIIYVLGAAGSFFGWLIWRLKNRPTKFPLGEDVKARRQAGEHLQRNVSKLMEKFLTHLMFLMFGPMCLPLILFVVVRPKTVEGIVPLLVAGAALLSAGLIWLWRKCFQLADEIQNTRLGLFGERIVADELEVLRGKGYVIFHDIPCLGATGPFNLDHVVVGQGIVVVVETKTYRKPKNNSGGHKVSYDGQKLIWPNRTSTDEIDQAISNGEWLRKELKERLGIEVQVHAVLTFPGWYVKGGPPTAPVLVENPKMLPQFIPQRFSRKIPDEKIDLIRRHLDAKCKDVNYEMM